MEIKTEKPKGESPCSKDFGFLIRKKPNSTSQWLCEFYITPPPLRVLSFKGGASRTFVYRPVLDYLEKNDILKQIEEVGGSSSGALAAVFACIPFKDSASRIKAMDRVSDTYLWDVMKETSGWQTYQTLTSPLHYFSKTTQWMSTNIDGLANYLTNRAGKLAGYPFKFSSHLFNALSLITSPRTYAALYNLVKEGGLYHGDLVQAAFRQQIKESVEEGLMALLEQQKDKESMIKSLQSIGLYIEVDGQFHVTEEITFAHLYALSQIPGSQFKQCYLSSARIKDKQLVVFNKDNTPDLPIHFACRIVGSFPVLFTDKSYLGQKYFDGGTINNGPVDLATDKKLPDLYENHDVTDKLARLNIRVEYASEYEHHLWRKKPDKSLFETIKNNVVQTILIFLMRGVDAYSNDEATTERMQRDYPQRTLQLKDFNISRFGSELTKEKRDAFCEQLIPDIESYFENHKNEKFILSYEISNDTGKPEDMPDDLQEELLAFLCDEKNKIEDIFDIEKNKQETSAALQIDTTEMEQIRIKLIRSLSKPDKILTSSAVILNKIGESKPQKCCQPAEGYVQEVMKGRQSEEFNSELYESKTLGI